MTSVKRLEIVITALALPELQKLLDAQSPAAYTIIRDVSGMGGGASIGDEISGALHNHMVIVAVEPGTLQAVIAAIEPLLRRFGGSCLVTDSQSL